MRSALLLFALAALAGCDSPDCPGRGASTTFAGSVAYDIAGNADASGLDAQGEAVTGALPASIVVYDLTTDCHYDGESFVVGVGACRLWLDLSTASEDGGVVLAGDVEPGAACTLELPTGPERATVTSGELSIAGVTELTLAGNVTLGDGGAGYIWWHFTGQ